MKKLFADPCCHLMNCPFSERITIQYYTVTLQTVTSNFFFVFHMFRFFFCPCQKSSWAVECWKILFLDPDQNPPDRWWCFWNLLRSISGAYQRRFRTRGQLIDVDSWPREVESQPGQPILHHHREIQLWMRLFELIEVFWFSGLLNALEKFVRFLPTQ